MNDVSDEQNGGELSFQEQFGNLGFSLTPSVHKTMRILNNLKRKEAQYLQQVAPTYPISLITRSLVPSLLNKL